MSDTTLPDLVNSGDEPLADPPPPFDDDDDLVLPPSRAKLPKLTVGLIVLAVLAVGFLGGALTQKHEGASSTAAGGAGGRLRAAGAAGFTGFGGAGAATGAGAAAGGGAAATPAVAPIAIGTVVSLTGNSLVVKDLGGHTRTITLGSGVTLTTSAPLVATALKAGDAVTVSGTTAANGTSSATTVLRRTSH